MSTAHPRPTTWIVVVLLLSMWGYWAGPRWNPEPLKPVVVPETSDTRITSRNPVPVGTYAVQTRIISVALRDGTSIRAKLAVPQGASGNLPAMVFVHGTGTRSIESFDTETAAIASTGIITLVPEKRTENYTLTHRDYSALSRDYEDALTSLLGVPGVDPQRTGLYLVSEGCFIGPIIAARNQHVAFTVFVSAPVLPIRAQGALAADAYLRNLHAPDALVRVIARMIGQQFGEDFRYIDFDVSSYQKQMTMPVFMLYGTGDMSMPQIQGVLAMRSDLTAAHNDKLTVRYYDGADHGLKVNKSILPQPMRDISDWVNGLPLSADSPPHIAGATPVQRYEAQTVAPAPLFASGVHFLLIMAAGIALLALASVAMLAGRIRVRGRMLMDTTPLGNHVLVSGAALVFAWAVLAVYVVVVAYFATSYQRNDLIVAGGWLLVQLSALAAAWFAVKAGFRLYETAAGLSWTAKVSVGASLAGQLILLLMLAYWGVYPSIL